MEHNKENMTTFEKASSVADYMNKHPESSIEEWDDYAKSQGMIRFDYSDDDWYRNEDYAIARVWSKFIVLSLDWYKSIKRINLWRVCIDGNPDDKWVNSLSEALNRAKEKISVMEKEGSEINFNEVTFQKKLF